MNSSVPRTEQVGRILWMHSHFMLATGGTKFIYEVVRRIAQQRTVEVLVEGASPLWRQRYAEAGVILHEMRGPTSTSMRYWAALPLYLRRASQEAYERGQHADVLVSSFFPMPWVANRVAATLRLRHVALCFEPFPYFYDVDVIGLYPRWKQTLLAGLARSYGHIDKDGIRGADLLLTLNATTQDQLERVYGRSDSIITHAGVDADLFRPYNDETLVDLRARFGDGPLVIHSTDYSPVKRTDLAVRAFAAANVQGAKLIITSTRPDVWQTQNLRRLARKLGVDGSVEHIGFLPFSDLPRLYAMADALLQTGTAIGSGATTMSLPVKEALACGTPVVRSHATNEDVEDEVSGFLVDPTDVERTGRKLAILLSDRDRARQMGEAGRRRITRLYTWERVAQVVLASLDRVP